MPRWVYLPLNTPAFSGHTTGRAGFPHPALTQTLAPGQYGGLAVPLAQRPSRGLRGELITTLTSGSSVEGQRSKRNSPPLTPAGRRSGPFAPRSLPASPLSGRRRRACALASVRRSNCTYGFPVCSFHEDCFLAGAIEGMSPTKLTSPYSPRLYTLSINEWTFLAPVGLIQSASLLGRGCTGFSLMELILLPALLIWLPLSFPPSSSAAFPNPLRSSR